MKERPILFSGPMVRALLDGSKTQMRRVVKRSNEWPANAVKAVVLETRGTALAVDAKRYTYGPEIKFPYGHPGDRLWVKETTVNVEDHGYVGPVYAESDEGRSVRDYGLSPDPEDMTEVEPQDLKLRPSIFMYRAMSRITLEIVSVRVERLQDISEVDALAEGVDRQEAKTTLSSIGMKDISGPVAEYSVLWEKINGAGSWDANPWVWVIEFRSVK
jgi:hypothetical protein